VALLGKLRDWELRAADAPPAPPFGSALESDSVSVIAEVKRRSPSKGVLDLSLDAAERARLYEEAGAAAVSILTEPTEFGGLLSDLEAASQAVSLPLLRKDFHVHPVQMFEARVAGASAALLIVRALGPDDTRIMADAAREAGLEPLFEVRDETELAWAADAAARIIGVNRRNLETLEMEDGVVEAILPQIPPFLFAVAESGISSRDDAARVAALGADAVLVGSAFSVARDAASAVSALTGIPRMVGARA
jgi:indole-3-glycerol phosphate synthase